MIPHPRPSTDGMIVGDPLVRILHWSKDGESAEREAVSE